MMAGILGGAGRVAAARSTPQAGVALALILLLATAACDRGPVDHFVYSPSGLSLRAGPSLDSPVIEVLPYGAPVRVLSRADEPDLTVIDGVSGRWLEVSAGLSTGYVFDGYVTRFPPPEDPGSIPEGPLVLKGFVFNAQVVSIRDEPGSGGGPLALVSYRDSLQILLGGLGQARDSLDGVEGEWVRVRWHQVEGFIFGSYLSEFRPLERRFAIGRNSLRVAFVQGTETLELRSAPDSAAASTGRLHYGDSVAVVRPVDPEAEWFRGIPGAWVYARAAEAEGFLFDAFLVGEPPPVDSTSSDPPPAPFRRYVVTAPGVRLWTQGERAIATDFVFYGDSLLTLFGGTPTVHAGLDGTPESFVWVKTLKREGRMAAESLSPIPAPVPGTLFRDYVEETLGEGAGGAPGSGRPLGSEVRYRFGVTYRTVANEAGLTRQVYRIPGMDIAQAFEFLRACGENEFFSARPMPTRDLTEPGFEVAVRLGPGGVLEGLYVLDTEKGELISLEASGDAVTLSFEPSPLPPPDPDQGDSVSEPARPDTTSTLAGNAP